MNYTSQHRVICFLSFILSSLLIYSQKITDFQLESEKTNNSIITNQINFNGYTNYWHDTYTNWFRYGNLFKIAMPEVNSTILQSKINVAEDLGLPGLLMQEGFLSNLFENQYKLLENPSFNDLENAIQEGNILVTTDPSTDIGRELEKKATSIFEWADNLGSHQLKDSALESIKAFYLINGPKKLFVISSSSAEQIKKLQNLIQNTRDVLDKYHMHKGLFGAASLLKSVTIEPGHPLEIMGLGMNEGNSWFIFDGYMDFLAQNEIEGWIKEINSPIVAEVGFSPIYGCKDYDNLQVQDMPNRESWINYAKKKGGYIFHPVYDPGSENYHYDGVFVNEGNKEQIDNEDVPFINQTGYLSGNLTSSMILFIEKNKPLTNETLWEAILNRKEVAVLSKAAFLGPAKYRHTIGLLYLDKEYLEDYFYDKIDLKAEVDKYNLLVTVKNYNTFPLTGKLDIITSSAVKVDNLPNDITLQGGEEKQFSISLQPGKEAMGKTNPVAVNFHSGEKTKKTLTMLDLPPAISAHQLLYAHAPEVNYPVTIHNFTQKNSFPVEVSVFRKGDTKKTVHKQTKTFEAKTASWQEQTFNLKVNPGDYIVRTKALDIVTETQLGVGKAEGKPYIYEVDLDGDGINEYRMENDSVQITLLRTGARVIEYIIKSKNDNVFYKGWPEKTADHRRPYRMRGYYPYGGFEDFLGQGSMETHRVYDAKITKQEGDYVQVEMEAEYYGNTIKKIFTLYGNTPLVEVRLALVFNDKDANVLGPQPILELGEVHGTEDVFTVPTTDGLKEYRMNTDDYYGQAFHIQEGWNAGYDTKENIAFIGAFPVEQPIFLHMWMNLPHNVDAPHSYVEFQPWTPIIQQSTMYFSYYLWAESGDWKKSLEELRKRNLISVRQSNNE